MTDGNAPMDKPLSEAERLAEIRRRLDACERGPRGLIGQSAEMFMWAGHDIEFLLVLVGVLKGQLATAQKELDEQRWYGEQLQSSIDACSGNHLPIESYEG